MDAYNTPARAADRTRRGTDYEYLMEHGIPVAPAGHFPGTDPLDYLGDNEGDDS